MGGDWSQLLFSIFISLTVSFLIAKLISMITALKDETNLPLTQSSSSSPHRRVHNRRLSNLSEPESEISDDLSVLAEKGSAAGGDIRLDDVDAVIINDDDDWEGTVGTTELDKAFSKATAFVANPPPDKMPNKVPNDVKLQLYGLYKIATDGPCSVPTPPAFKRTARAKWNAWHKLGAMPPEDAMQKYIDIVTELFPSWTSAAAAAGDKDESGHTEEVSSDSKALMGPVLSSISNEEESGNDLKMDAMHAFAREGDIDKLLKCFETGVSVNLKDREGRTPLHWAVDRGHLSVVELLLSKRAEVNVKDNEGRTPLHYAVVCDKEAIADCLVKYNADIHVKDNKGDSPSVLCEKKWPCMQLVDIAVE